MNPRDQLAKEFLVGLLMNTEYNGFQTTSLVAMAYEVADAFLNQIDLSCPRCHVKPDAEGKVIHVSGCPEGWSES